MRLLLSIQAQGTCNLLSIIFVGFEVLGEAPVKHTMLKHC